jgi:hypothetical protein
MGLEPTLGEAAASDQGGIEDPVANVPAIETSLP